MANIDYNPTPQQLANRQLAASGNPPTAAPTTSAPYGGSGFGTTSNYNDQAASELNSYLTGGTVAPSESSYENTLLGQYNANTKATEDAYANEIAGIGQDYTAQLGQLNRENASDLGTVGENNMGVGASALAYQNSVNASKTSQLLGSEAAAKTGAATAETGAISTLSQNYASNLQNARANMLSALGTAATMVTPEQKNQLAQQAAQQAAVVTLQTQDPGAGILNTDDLATATAKYKAGRVYQNNVTQGQATINELNANASAASAAAGASAASAAQTRTLTAFMGTPGTTLPQTDPDVQYLLNGGTIEGLTARYAGTPQAVKVPSIIQSAQSYGYNQNSATLGYNAANTNAQNVGAGGYTGASTAATNILGSFLGGAFGSNPSSYNTPYVFGPTAGRSLTTPVTTYMLGEKKYVLQGSDGLYYPQ